MIFSLSNRNYGWMIVFIAFILNAIAFGTMASVSMFLKPLVHEFGWTRGSLSMGYTIMTLATSVSGVLWSILVDKYGSRWISRLGAFTIGIPLILLSNIEHISDFYLYYFFFGAIGHATVTGPLYASVGLWFSRNVGLALGCTFAGSAVGQGVIPYIARYLIDGYGWQQAYLYLGIGYLIIAAPISLFLREAPSRSEFSGASNNQKKEGKEGPSNIAIVGWISLLFILLHRYVGSCSPSSAITNGPRANSKKCCECPFNTNDSRCLWQSSWRKTSRYFGRYKKLCSNVSNANLCDILIPIYR